MIDGLIATHVPESLRGGGIAAFIRIKMFGADPFKRISECTEPTLLGTRIDEIAPALQPSKTT